MMLSTHDYSCLESDDNDDYDNDDSCLDTDGSFWLSAPAEECEWADGDVSDMWRGHAKICLRDLKGLIADVERFSVGCSAGRCQLLYSLVIPQERAMGVCSATLFVADAERLVDSGLGEPDDGFGPYPSDDDDASAEEKDTEITEWCAGCREHVAAARAAHDELARLWRQREEAIDEWRTPEDAGQERGLPTMAEVMSAVDVFKTSLQALQLQFEKLFPSKRAEFTRMLMHNELSMRERLYILAALSA